jgi:hypothetical protein
MTSAGATRAHRHRIRDVKKGSKRREETHEGSPRAQRSFREGVHEDRPADPRSAKQTHKASALPIGTRLPHRQLSTSLPVDVVPKRDAGSRLGDELTSQLDLEMNGGVLRWWMWMYCGHSSGAGQICMRFPDKTRLLGAASARWRTVYVDRACNHRRTKPRQ